MTDDWNSEWISPAYHSEKQRAAHWDNMSQSFDGYGELDGSNDHIAAFFEKKGILRPDMRVLDIGCAAGKYSLYFAKHCKEVLGTDISPKMLERARANADKFGVENVSFVRSDWDNLDLEEIGGGKSFDLIFASLTPAISSEAGFKKLLQAARGWCYYSGAASGKRSVGDRVHKLFKLSPEVRGNGKSIPYAFNQLWQAGIRPELHYISHSFTRHMSIQEANEHYSNTIGSMLALRQGFPFTEEQRKTLGDFLETVSEDGIINDEFQSVTAVLLWHM